MIIVRIHKRHDEAQFALLMAGETKGRVFVNFPIKGHTRKVYGKALWLVTKGLV